MSQNQQLSQELNSVVAAIKAGAYDQITRLTAEIRKLEHHNQQVNALLQSCCDAAGCEVGNLHEKITELCVIPQPAKKGDEKPSK